MTLEEFSNGFDTLVSSYLRFRDFDSQEPRDTIEFNEYEKSLYLTLYQEELVTALYNGKNIYGDSFESSEEMRRNLSSLIREATLSPITTTDNNPLGIESTSKFFTLPDGSGDEDAVWFITYEAVNVSGRSNCDDGSTMEVVPITQDEYHRVKKNPFRGPTKRRALRLDLSEGVVEIVCNYTVTSYYIRYLTKPTPIILEDLHNDLTIEGESEATSCTLNDSLHRKILEGAVIKALQSKGININKDNS